MKRSIVRSLEQAWKPARHAGAIGTQSVDSLRDHALGFIINEWRRHEGLHLVDIGTGAGVPGILLSVELPESRWTLIDRSRRRCDYTNRAVQVLKLGDRVSVRHTRAGQFSRSCDGRERFDGATARLFGPVTELAECGLPLLKVGASLVVSVSRATSDQWMNTDLTDKTGCEVASHWTTRHGSFIAIKRIKPPPDALPRRAAARRRSPLLHP